ncbi:hypothetical protein FRACYDRAFT_232438 [Fragilariopsis cylindrus CCMP1102]|uniref:Uncharacterized protein n=1 Tax=Fragilariopsis cylindrus CCMP1102 TaxID=635003 RepID=A0A1E7FVY6_9STRA|nr:hypothetical protein FRACYDRAFT_232438 [Fragilariopsis cylindrus CCMP1102]|eukprot:OEU22284.1 hypothetical protein FRACYDRAFT_232438 [Fragilariopsis cylindrus CCMP1102]
MGSVINAFLVNINIIEFLIFLSDNGLMDVVQFANDAVLETRRQIMSQAMIEHWANPNKKGWMKDGTICKAIEKRWMEDSAIRKAPKKGWPEDGTIWKASEKA